MRMNWKAVVIGSVCAWSFLGYGHSVKMETPADGAVLTQLHPVQEMLVRLSLDDWKELISHDVIAKYWQNQIKSFPGGVHLDWSVKRTGDEKLTYRLEYGRDPELKDAITVVPPHSEYRLYNLYLGETYYYRVSLVKEDKSVEAQTPILKFTMEMLPPRVMMVPGVDNFRDLGGYEALDGRRVKQGMIYRSTGLNANSADRGKTPGKPRFTEAGKRVLLDEIKLKTELDLRWADEIAGMTTSPLGESVRYVSNPSPLYAGAFTVEGKAIYAKSFRVFTDPANYPVNFHCIAGSDRTGTLAYLLEAVLGVPEEMLQKEYVFTSFYATRNFRYLEPIPASLKACGKPGESAMEQAERYWTSAGITPAEIQKFRDIMLGEGTQPDAILQEAQRLLDVDSAIAAKYSLPVPDAKIVPCKVFQRSGVIAGKTLSCALPEPDTHRAEWSMAADGGFAWRLGNGGARPLLLALEGKLPGKADDRFYFGERYSDVWYNSPSGKAEWSLDELAKLTFFVPVQTDFALVAVPTNTMAKPEKLSDYQFVTEKDAQIPVAPVTELAKAPQIGGKTPDAIWESVPKQLCTDAFGKALAKAPVVQLATDKAHGAVYLKAEISDDTPVATLTGEQVRVWAEDSIEFFIAESTGKDCLQLVLGRSGGWYVEWRGAWKKNPAKLPEGTQYAVQEIPGGWRLEAVIPLTGLELKSFPRFNVCGGDRPAELLFNLAPSNGDFPNVKTMAVPEFHPAK